MGGNLSDVALWLKMPIKTILYILKTKRDQVEKQKEEIRARSNSKRNSKTPKIVFTTQFEAHIDFLKSTMPPEEFEKMDLIELKARFN